MTIVTALASDPADANHENSFVPGRRVDLPIHVYREYLAVTQGSAGSRTGLNFLVDTGAYPTVLSQHLARELRLSETAGKLELADRTIPVKHALLPSLQVGPVRKESLSVLVVDLSFTERALGTTIDDVIGLDVLGANSFSIDYRARKIAFGAEHEACTHRAAFQTGPPFITIKMNVREIPLRLLVDTGASGLLLFQNRVQNLTRTLHRGAIRTTLNIGGNFQLTDVLLPVTTIGGTNLNGIQASLLDDQSDVGRDFDGLLGVSSLRAREIVLDFQRRVFCWE